MGWMQDSADKGIAGSGAAAGCMHLSCLHTVRVGPLSVNGLTFTPLILAVLFTNFKNDSVGDN